MPFKPFGNYHLLYIFAMSIAWIAIPYISLKLNKEYQWKIAIVLVASILGLELIDDIYRTLDADVGWNISGDLPLHMCGFSVLATSWVLITRNQLVFELCYFWGFGGAIQAILTPDPTGIYNHFYLFSFMASHGLIILNLFFIIFVYKMILRKGALLRTIFITNILLIGIGIINYLLDGNYFYLNKAPTESGNPLIINWSDILSASFTNSIGAFGEWILYLINLEGVSILVLSVIYIPMIIYRRRSIEN